MKRQTQPILRLNSGTDVEALPREVRGTFFGKYIYIGNIEAAEAYHDIFVPAERNPALLSCCGRLPTWWEDHEKREVAALAVGFDDWEVDHPDEKETMLRMAAEFVDVMVANRRSVMVFCDRGASRSVVVVAYYWARKRRIGIAQALEEVMRQVSWAAPSLGMIELAVRTWTQWDRHDE